MKYLILSMLIIAFQTTACTFTMGYRLNERLPLIGASPDSEGLYKELFSTALKKIDCELIIIREPKKRIIKKLVDGRVDFYPGFTFSKERSDYVYFFENGLEMSFLAISTLKQAKIINIKQLEMKVVLVAHGGPTLGVEKVGAIIRHVEDLTVEGAIGHLLNGKGDFYLYPKASIDYYLRVNPQPEIQRHSCCGESSNMMLGFSKNSTHLSVKASTSNVDFYNKNDTAQLGIPKNSKAFALKQALQQLKHDGTINKIYSKYY